MNPLRFALFVKHWKNLSVAEMGDKVKSLGFDLIELPVRPGFACEPETVERDLPRVVQEFADMGIDILGVTAANALDDERLYATCAELGITQNRIMLRTGDMTYWDAEAKARKELDAAVPLCEKYGVRIGIQNHKARFIASSAIGLYHLLKDYDPKHIGAVWDPAHNALEGEEPELAIDVIAPHIHFVNLKNGYWQRTNGPEAQEAQWQVHWTSGPHGRASWPRVARKLKEVDYSGPFCFSAEHSDSDALERLVVEDLAYARSVFEEAGFTI